MGSCWSKEQSSLSVRLPTANVVSVDGSLRQYPLPITASQAIHRSAADEAPASTSLFLCSSDALLYDEFIPEMEPHNLLHPHEIYFVLPVSKLQNRLSASDMAALAVRASTALRQIPLSRRRKSRISPAAGGKAVRTPPPFKTSSDGFIGAPSLARGNNTIKRSITPSAAAAAAEAAAGPGISRSGSFRKLHKYSSRRARLAVRSVGLKLSTIYEGSVLCESFRRTFDFKRV